MVWLAMSLIRRTTSPMRAVASERPCIVPWLASARSTACRATVAATVTCCPIAPKLVVSSSTAAATAVRSCDDLPAACEVSEAPLHRVRRLRHRLGGLSHAVSGAGQRGRYTGDRAAEILSMLHQRGLATLPGGARGLGFRRPTERLDRVLFEHHHGTRHLAEFVAAFDIWDLEFQRAGRQ